MPRRNPKVKLPTKWTAAKVRVDQNGRVQLAVNPRAIRGGKVAKGVRNVERGFYNATGFHPLRSSSDYDADRAGDDYSDTPKRKKAAKKKKKNPFRADSARLKAAKQGLRKAIAAAKRAEHRTGKREVYR